MPPPVVEYEEETQRGGGCVPWVLGGIGFLMVIALVAAAVVLLPKLTNPTANPTPAPTLASGTAVPVAKVAVPNIAKLSQTDAEAALAKANLKVGTVTQQDSTQAANTVIQTDPKIGTQVDVTTPINLVISKGQAQVQLNDYTNRDPDATIKQLQQLGFQVQRVDQFDPDFSVGAVIGTDPKGGPNVTVAKGALIKVLVSKGPEPTATPNVPTPTPVPPTATPVPVTPTPTTKPVIVKVPTVVGEQQADGIKALKAMDSIRKLSPGPKTMCGHSLAGLTSIRLYALTTT